jgi:hypothetical protein
MNVIEDFWGDIKIKFHHLYCFLLSGGMQTHLVLHGSNQVNEHWAKPRPLLSDLEANQVIKSITTPDSNKMLNISNETAIVLLGSEGHSDQLLQYLSDHRSP